LVTEPVASAAVTAPVADATAEPVADADAAISPAPPADAPAPPGAPSAG
jgi:hypothetical protein